MTIGHARNWVDIFYQGFWSATPAFNPIVECETQTVLIAVMIENVPFSADCGDSKAFLNVFPIDNLVFLSGNDDNFLQISVPDNRSETWLNAVRVECCCLLACACGQVAFYNPLDILGT